MEFRRLSLLLLLGIGCTPTTECADAADCDSAGDSAAPDLFADAEDPVPYFTAEGVGEQLQAYVDKGSWGTKPLAETLVELLEAGDELCPGTEENSTVFEQLTGCTSTTGYTYQGTGWYFTADKYETEDGPAIPLSWGYGGDYTITDPEGSQISCGGGGSFTSVIDEGGLTFAFEFSGSYYDERQTGWTSDLSAVVAGTGGIDVNNATRWITVDGGVKLGSLAVYFDAFTWDTTTDCGEQPTGALRLRDERGYWYEWDLTDSCGPCGNVTFHEDQDLGELCFDMSEYGKDLFLQLSQ